MTDIVERISQLPELANLPGGALAADCFEAAIEIKKLRTENAKLRAALKPFAEQVGRPVNIYEHEGVRMAFVDQDVLDRLCRAAAAALKETEDE